MANPDEKTVAEKVRKSDYANLFLKVFGKSAFKETDKTFNNIANAIAEYEKSSELNQFNSTIQGVRSLEFY